MFSLDNCSCRGSQLDSRAENAFVRDLCSKGLPPSNDLGLNETLATKLAIDALDHCPKPISGVPACRIHRPGLKQLPFHIFAKLDDELFCGVLKNEVYLKWTTLPPELHGITSRPGLRDTRITIDLNKLLIHRRVPSQVLVVILIHHMAHAYFLVCCGFRSEIADIGKYSLGHGLGFSTLIHRITEILRSSGMNELPNLFNCYPNTNRSLETRSSHSKQRIKPLVGGSFCSWYTSDFLSQETCHSHLLSLREMHPSQQILKIMDSKSSRFNAFPKLRYLHTVDLEKSQFIPVLRAQYRLPQGEYVELHYSNLAVPVASTTLKDFPSLLSKVLTPDSILPVPAPTDSIFFTFYTFLLNRDYSPELSPIVSPYLIATSSQGPPLIATYLPSEPAYLITDIRMFVLASRLSCGELRSKALERLYSMGVTHNDPIAVLEEIYGDSAAIEEEDKNTLRSWVRDFLSKARPGSDMTNMLVLEQDHQWSRRLTALKHRFGVFAADWATVRENFVLQKAVSIIGNGKEDFKSANLLEEGKGKGEVDVFSSPAYLDFGIHQLDAPGTPLPSSLPRSTLRDQHGMHRSLSSSPLSSSELQLLRDRFPSISILYERTLEEQKKKDEMNAKDKGKGKCDENEGNVYSKSRSHRREHCHGEPSCSHHPRIYPNLGEIPCFPSQIPSNHGGTYCSPFP